MRRWIAGDDSITIGTIGYLVETTVAGRTSWSLHERPVPGWFGAGKLVRRNKTRSRVEVLQLHGAQLYAFLQKPARGAAA
jgi:hypothetical protein